MSTIIEPNLLRGFRDFLPATELTRNKIRTTLESVFRGFGFVPIDTPALEYAEILLGKGGGETDKQIYRFQDHGKRDVALRFDLTVPFARFMAKHYHQLTLPFKRYHMGKVWRGENTQRGRYREFTQIDFDIVGVDSASSDFEILMLMQKAFVSLGVNAFKVHFFHRGVLNAFLNKLGLRENSPESRNILRSIDKIKKIGPAEVTGLLQEFLDNSQAEAVMRFIQGETTRGETTRGETTRGETTRGETTRGETTRGETTRGETTRGETTNAKTLAAIGTMVDPNCAPYLRISEIARCIADCGLDDFFVLDPSITRGLDYYTGVVFETFLTGLPKIGSVCSGGRYNNLASLYTKEHLPGVGSSIGLDRLISALEELNLLEEEAAGPDLIILMVDEPLLSRYHCLAASLREAGLSVEVYPTRKKLALQFNYAAKRAIPLALIMGETEFGQGKMSLKDLRARKTYEQLTLDTLIETARELLRL
jgi:histidyl-tRNA synthetase